MDRASEWAESVWLVFIETPESIPQGQSPVFPEL